MQLEYGSQLDPITRVALFISFWFAFMVLSMVTSLAYCCCPFLWMKTKSRLPVITGDRQRNCATAATPHQSDDGTSFIKYLISSLFNTDYPQPEPQAEKKKRKFKRKFETKNGWRRKLCKRKASNKGTRKSKRKKPREPNKLKLQQATRFKLIRLETRITEKSKTRKQPITKCKVSPAPQPGCPPQLKGRRRTLELLHRAKRRIKKKTKQSQAPSLHICYTSPPIPCQCQAQHPYTLNTIYIYTDASNCSEDFILQSPVQDTDDQTDDLYEYSVSKDSF